MAKIEISYKGNDLNIEYFYRWWKEKTIVYIHWLWCSRSDFNEAINNELFNDFNILSFDLIWHWNSSYIKDIDINDTVEIVNLLLKKLNISDIILIWHSLWWVISLMFIYKYPDIVSAFINVEWNLSSSDCFFSRKATKINYETFEKQCFNKFIEELIDTNKKWFWQYVHTLEKHKPLKSFYEICSSLVDLSDNWNLLEKYINLSIPKLFLYWEENCHLPYITKLEKAKCKTISVSDSNHFPQFDNPSEFFKIISDFLKNIKEL